MNEKKNNKKQWMKDEHAGGWGEMKNVLYNYNTYINNYKISYIYTYNIYITLI